MTTVTKRISGVPTVDPLQKEAANYFLAGPASGGAAAPTWRQMVNADLPQTVTLTAGAAATTPLTLNQFSTGQTAALLSLGVGNPASASGSWIMYERPASKSLNGVPWRAVVNHNWFPGGGPGGADYGNEVVGIGFNTSSVIAVPAVAGKAMLWDTWEYKFNSGGTYVAERHMELVTTAGVKHRWFGSALAHDGSTGRALFALDFLDFYGFVPVSPPTDITGPLRATLNFSQPGLHFYDFATSHAAAIRLAGGSKELCLIGGGNQSGTTIDQVQIGTDVHGAVANLYFAIAPTVISLVSGVPAHGAILFDITSAAATNATIASQRWQGSTNWNLITDLVNLSTAAGARVYHRVATASVTGEAGILFEKSSGEQLLAGKNQSDHFELCNYEAFGTRTVLTVDKTSLLATFAAGLTSSHATAGLGYGTGAGGTVTQLTSKSTGVEVNKVAGAITTHNATLNAGAHVGFTVTNSAVAATDLVLASIKSGASADSYSVDVDAVAAGSFRLSLTNKSAGNLGEAIVINFVVIKGVAA